MQTTLMPPDPILQGELKQDERLLWWGRPDVNRWKKQPANNAFRVLSAPFFYIIVGAIIFLIVFVALSFSHTLTHSSDLGAVLIAILGLGWYFLGLVRFSAPLKVRPSAIKGLPMARYAITDQRVIVISAVGTAMRVTSHTRSDIGRIVREEIGDGWGNVLYGLPYQTRVGYDVVMVVDKLECIPNVRLVEDILIKTFKNSQLPVQPMVAEQHVVPPPLSYPPMSQG